MPKILISHCDTCLPDYWGGHHLAHVQIPVYNGMKISELRRYIKNELSQGAVAGKSDLAFLLSADYVGPDRADDAEKAFKKALAAVNRIKQAKRGRRNLFPDLDKEIEDCDSQVYAFFIIEWE
jgi:hypothetical protein